MTLIFVSIAINGFVSLSMFSGEYPEAFGWIMSCFVALSLVGVVLMSGENKRLGAKLVMVGCVIFVPIGLIGVFGARQVLDALNREEFEQRRAKEGNQDPSRSNQESSRLQESENRVG
jgi:hypothetical protein